MTNIRRWITTSLFLGLALLGLVFYMGSRAQAPDVAAPQWTRSWELYGQPHAVWLSRYDAVGANAEELEKALKAAKAQGKTPEIVVYSIPLRDMEQSSAGGFTTWDNYMADNRQNAGTIQQYMADGNPAPRIYLEPDTLGHAIQYRRERHDDTISTDLYDRRIRGLRELVKMYQDAGAKVYLDAAHSDWFDYGEADIQAMAGALNAAGMGQADGVVTNVSNRQKVTGAGRTEAHYIGRLLPLLDQPPGGLDVVVDTSRNGGPTKQRHYHLHDRGMLIDNETPDGRLVGSWYEDDREGLMAAPFFGDPMAISILTTKDKYTYNPQTRILSAPPWLDAVGDVQPGPQPSDNPGVPNIHRFRYIKPPDDCDGSLNCPPGLSKSRINAATQDRQPPAERFTAPQWPEENRF